MHPRVTCVMIINIRMHLAVRRVRTYLCELWPLWRCWFKLSAPEACSDPELRSTTSCAQRGPPDGDTMPELVYEIHQRSQLKLRTENAVSSIVVACVSSHFPITHRTHAVCTRLRAIRHQTTQRTRLYRIHSNFFQIIVCIYNTGRWWGLTVQPVRC